MTDKPIPDDEMDDKIENGSDTLIVPPPNYRERLKAAQHARSNEVRGAVEIPNPLAKSSTPPNTEGKSPEPELHDDKRKS